MRERRSVDRPSQLEVPTLAFDASRILLVWHKPESYAGVVDYNVYMDGHLLGGADANNLKFSPAKRYVLSYTQNNNVYVSAPTPAEFRDIVVQNVSIDGGGSTAIQVDGFDPATAAQDLEDYGNVYNENIVFKHVVMNGLRPTRIDHLKDSIFENVVFTNVVGGLPPWVITNSPGLQFLGTTTRP